MNFQNCKYIKITKLTYNTKSKTWEINVILRKERQTLRIPGAFKLASEACHENMPAGPGSLCSPWVYNNFFEQVFKAAVWLQLSL